MFFCLATAGVLLRLYTARCLRLRKNYVFCQVVAGLSCVDIPYGTALGVTTLVVLGRPSVRDLFERGEVQTATFDAGGI